MPKSPRTSSAALYHTLPVPTFHPPLTRTVTRTPCEQIPSISCPEISAQRSRLIPSVPVRTPSKPRCLSSSLKRSSISSSISSAMNCKCSEHVASSQRCGFRARKNTFSPRSTSIPYTTASAGGGKSVPILQALLLITYGAYPSHALCPSSLWIPIHCAHFVVLCTCVWTPTRCRMRWCPFSYYTGFPPLSRRSTLAFLTSSIRRFSTSFAPSTFSRT